MIFTSTQRRLQGNQVEQLRLKKVSSHSNWLEENRWWLKLGWRKCTVTLSTAKKTKTKTKQSKSNHRNYPPQLAFSSTQRTRSYHNFFFRFFLSLVSILKHAKSHECCFRQKSCNHARTKTNIEKLLVSKKFLNIAFFFCIQTPQIHICFWHTKIGVSFFHTQTEIHANTHILNCAFKQSEKQNKIKKGIFWSHAIYGHKCACSVFFCFYNFLTQNRNISCLVFAHVSFEKKLAKNKERISKKNHRFSNGQTVTRLNHQRVKELNGQKLGSKDQKFKRSKIKD